MKVICQFVVALILGTMLGTALEAGSKTTARAARADGPSTPPVELFEALERGLIETNVIARNAHAANVFVTNKTKQGIAVQFPVAVVAVPVLKQRFGQTGANGGLMNPGGNAGGNGGGMSQSIGGGMQLGGGGGAGNAPGGGFNNGFNGMNNNGQGIFSIPSEGSVKIPLATVCLSHGKPDPRARIKYQLVKLEDYSDDPVLHETLKLFAAGVVDTETAQAAAWHLTDHLSWEELRMKQIEPFSFEPVYYFSEGKVDAALQLVRQAQANARPSRRAAETASLRRE
ncbi:MAG: hypothetical protein JSS02_08715 [Planctomycetes bacterium]|nr:hypothetical protein [Planctomycetota bacterium]